MKFSEIQVNFAREVSQLWQNVEISVAINLSFSTAKVFGILNQSRFQILLLTQFKESEAILIFICKRATVWKGETNLTIQICSILRTKEETWRITVTTIFKVANLLTNFTN
jgi:hypothetical protein